MTSGRLELHRDLLPARGAAFFVQKGVVMFRFVTDAVSVYLQPAKEQDAKDHAEAWALFVEAKPKDAAKRLEEWAAEAEASKAA